MVSNVLPLPYLFRNYAEMPKIEQKALDLDNLMQELHDAEFERTDCLTCANCCKTTGPLFTDKDVERIAKHLKMRQQYLLYE